jgi:hypothetical protein
VSPIKTARQLLSSMSILLASTDSTNRAAVSWNTLRRATTTASSQKTNCTEAACLGGASPRPRKKKGVGLRKPQEAEKTGKGNARTAAGKPIRINPIENSRRAGPHSPGPRVPEAGGGGWRKACGNWKRLPAGWIRLRKRLSLILFFSGGRD